jgi:hypothetical protein
MKSYPNQYIEQMPTHIDGVDGEKCIYIHAYKHANETPIDEFG